MVEFQSICYAIWILCLIWMVIFLLKVFKFVIHKFIPSYLNYKMSKNIWLISKFKPAFNNVNKYTLLHSAHVLNFVKYTMHIH